MLDYLSGIHFPKIGMRIIKSVISMLLCFLIYLLRGQNGILFYSIIAALQCIQPYQAGTRKFARNRSVGTVIGAVWGLLFMLFFHYIHVPFMENILVYYPLVCLLSGAVLYTTVVLNVKDTAYFTTVVFLSIVVNHLADTDPWTYVFNRVLDTFVGVAAGILVSDFHLPREKHKDVLYITGIDNTLTEGQNPISDYSRIELNRIIDEGANVTVSTRQTPALVRENLSGVKLKLPVIVMDGAALFDLTEKRYLATTEMTEEEAAMASRFLDAEGIHYCTNKIIDDLLIIYYGDNANDTERKVIETRRTSAYRNYVHRTRPVYDHVVYLFLILPDRECRALHEKMSAHPGMRKLKIVMEPMNGYPGYTFLKIFSPKTSRESMIAKLKDITGLQKVVVFGCSRPHDVRIENPGHDALVRQLKKYYEPLRLPWRKPQESQKSQGDGSQ